MALRMVMNLVQKLAFPEKIREMLDKLEDLTERILLGVKENEHSLDKLEYIEKSVDKNEDNIQRISSKVNDLEYIKRCVNENEDNVKAISSKVDDIEKLNTQLDELKKNNKTINDKLDAIINGKQYIKRPSKSGGFFCTK